MLICLDIGCGFNKIELVSHRVIGLDNRPETKCDIVCDVTNLPFKRESVDAIYSSHCLEHFKALDIQSILYKWTKVVRKNGDIYIKVPDIKFACRNILNDIYTLDEFSILYGKQDYPSNFHNTGFTVKLLESWIKEFAVGKCYSNGREVIFEGIRR